MLINPSSTQSSLSAAIGRVGEAPGRRDWIIVLIIFLLNSAVVYPVFFPSLHQIGGWDESVYINEGRELVEGTLPRFSHNPAVAALYALTYLPFMSSPYWLIHSCSLGRFVLFGLMWLASFLVATRLTGLASPLIMIALVAMSPALAGLLNNGSNALFAAMSAFALWQFLGFHRTQAVRHLWLCSTFVGVAALSRNEGSVLFLSVVGLTFALSLRARIVGKAMVAAVIPFVLMVGGYVGVYGMLTGSFNLGVRERSYFTFEQGHGMAFAASYGTLQAYVEGQNDAPRLFGTAEENNYSILNAIRRNPGAYFQRIPLLTKSAVKDLFAGYNWHFALLAFALAARGVLGLLASKSYALLAILLLWPAYAALYVLLCYQPTHLLLPFPTIFALASFGITAVAHNLNSRSERLLWSGGLLTLAAAGAVVYRQPNDLLAAPLLLLAALWLVWLVTDQMDRASRSSVSVACIVLVTVILVVRFGVVHAVPRSLGSTADEQATLYLRQHFRPGTGIGAYAPGKIWTANMAHVQMVNFRAMDSSEALWTWMARERVEAIYVDHQLRTFEPVVWDTIQKQIGHGLEVAFQGPGGIQDGDEPVQVLVRASS